MPIVGPIPTRKFLRESSPVPQSHKMRTTTGILKQIQGTESGSRVIVWIARKTLILWFITLSGCGDSQDPVKPSVSKDLNPCVKASSACAQSVQLGQQSFLPILRTHSLDRGDPRVQTAIIIIHGTTRNHSSNFETMILAAQQRDPSLSKTIVIAPKFQIVEDNPTANEPFWTNSGWKKGHLSVTDSKPRPRVSSYSAIEKIIELLSTRSGFPELREIIVTGHSAGGQVAHRFAAGRKPEETSEHINTRYVVANPSTYLYLGPERFIDGYFSSPIRSECPEYDYWHYGLKNLNTYMRSTSLDQIRENLVARNVTILIGDQDVDSYQLDVSCGANLQGDNRFSRGQNLIRYMDSLFPANNHTQKIVSGVAHSGKGMYTSPEGISVLFPS